MPIVFEQPQAYDPGTASAYGALQQEMANRAAMGHGGGGGGAYHPQPEDRMQSYGGGGGGGGSREDISMYDDRERFQERLSQAVLTQQEEMRVQQLKTGLSAVNERVQAGALTPAEGDDLSTQIMTGLNPLLQRQQRAHTLHEQAQTQATNQQMMIQSAHENARLASIARAGPDNQIELFHPSVLAEAESAIDAQYPQLRQYALDGVPEAERYRKEMIESKARQMNGSTHFIVQPDGKYVKIDRPDPRPTREPMVTPEVTRKTYSDASREVRDELHTYQRELRAAKTKEERDAVHVPSWMNDRQGNILDFMEGAFGPGGADREAMMQREIDRRARSLLGHYQRQEPGATQRGSAPTGAGESPTSVRSQQAALAQLMQAVSRPPARPSAPLNPGPPVQQGPQFGGMANVPPIMP